MNCAACKFDNSEGRGVCRLIEAAGVRGLRSYDCLEFEEKENEKMHPDDNKSTIGGRSLADRCGDVADELRKDVEDLTHEVDEYTQKLEGAKYRLSQAHSTRNMVLRLLGIEG